MVLRAHELTRQGEGEVAAVVLLHELAHALEGVGRAEGEELHEEVEAQHGPLHVLRSAELELLVVELDRVALGRVGQEVEAGNLVPMRRRHSASVMLEIGDVVQVRSDTFYQKLEEHLPAAQVDAPPVIPAAERLEEAGGGGVVGGGRRDLLGGLVGERVVEIFQGGAVQRVLTVALRNAGGRDDRAVRGGGLLEVAHGVEDVGRVVRDQHFQARAALARDQPHLLARAVEGLEDLVARELEREAAQRVHGLDDEGGAALLVRGEGGRVEAAFGPGALDGFVRVVLVPRAELEVARVEVRGGLEERIDQGSEGQGLGLLGVGHGNTSFLRLCAFSVGFQSMFEPSFRLKTSY